MSSLSDRQAAHRPQDTCGRCGFPVITLIPGVLAHATAAGSSACALARGMAQFNAAGWNLAAPAAGKVQQ